MFEEEPRVKTLLYVYRTLLTGIHLVRAGEVQASLPILLDEYPQPGVAELIAAKRSGAEKMGLALADVDRHRGAYQDLVGRLERAEASSPLPDRPTGSEALEAFLIRVRLRE
jgi:predicted nucleotidyltransferase